MALKKTPIDHTYRQSYLVKAGIRFDFNIVDTICTKKLSFTFYLAVFAIFVLIGLINANGSSVEQSMTSLYERVVNIINVDTKDNETERFASSFAHQDLALHNTSNSAAALANRNAAENIPYALTPAEAQDALTGNASASAVSDVSASSSLSRYVDSDGDSSWFAKGYDVVQTSVSQSLSNSVSKVLSSAEQLTNKALFLGFELFKKDTGTHGAVGSYGVSVSSYLSEASGSYGYGEGSASQGMGHLVAADEMEDVGSGVKDSAVRTDVGVGAIPERESNRAAEHVVSSSRGRTTTAASEEGSVPSVQVSSGIDQNLIYMALILVLAFYVVYYLMRWSYFNHLRIKLRKDEAPIAVESYAVVCLDVKRKFIHHVWGFLLGENYVNWCPYAVIYKELGTTHPRFFLTAAVSHRRLCFSPEHVGRVFIHRKKSHLYSLDDKSAYQTVSEKRYAFPNMVAANQMTKASQDCMVDKVEDQNEANNKA